MQSRRQTGRQLFESVASHFLKTGVRLPLVHSSGIGAPCQMSSRRWKAKAMGAASGSVSSRYDDLLDITLSASIGRLFGPGALWFCIFCNIALNSS